MTGAGPRPSPSTGGPTTSAALIEVRGVRKAFDGARALSGVSLTVARGEIVALLGHNGSGKSTLVKILAGVLHPDAGLVERHATTVHVIHQTLGLVEGLSAIENFDIVSGRGLRAFAPIAPRKERLRVRELLGRFDAGIDPELPVRALTAAQRTIVAIVRALDGWDDGDHLLVLDEPTATLHDDEAAVLLESVRRVAAQGVGVVYISHRLGEVVGLADRAVVLRDGEVVAEHRRGAYGTDELLSAIAPARSGHAANASRRRPGEVALSVRGLRGSSVAGVDVSVRAGEVVGIAGLIGSGMEHVNSLIFGGATPAAGDVVVRGRVVRPGSPRASIRRGLGHLPADRLTRGGIAAHSARENLTLPRLAPLRAWHGGIHGRREVAEAERWMTRVGARPGSSSQRSLRAFSGGNQQKVLLARWLRLAPAVLLLDEPTQGVDVGAQREIHALLHATAADGSAILVSSSDTRELAQLCDRVVVMRGGRVGDELGGRGLTESALVHAMLGEHPRPQAGATAPGGDVR